MSGAKFTDGFKRAAVAPDVDLGYPVREVAGQGTGFNSHERPMGGP